MNNNLYFHFTLGPVQGFVSQARRTRDFWAGSFLLSWLSGVAIKATEHQGGKILFPQANTNFMGWLEGNGEEGKEPQQGSIPNRFKAAVNADFKPEEVTQAIQTAWLELADHIWERDINSVFRDDPILSKPGEIWDRQIPQFWDMTWVITNDIDDSSALDRRKNWRTWSLPDEPGVKCSVMGDLQEISGADKPNRNELDKFWGKLRNNNGTKGKNGIDSDFSEKEAVCAITYVKRRFSRYFKEFSHIMPQGWTLKGWEVPSGVPSVSYMAAVHWLEKANELIQPDILNDFSKQAKTLTGNYGEWQTRIRCLQGTDNHLFNKIDGNVFFSNNLENPQLFPQKEQQKKDLLTKLNEINKTKGMEPPAPFYAVLMMDGDSLGIQMSNSDNHDTITKGLDIFTQGVKETVYNNNGFLIYAGGDDVLAILPLEDAIPCAVKLRDDYLNCFAGKIDTTLSAAIEYVHVKTPLTKILKDAHQLLDDVAKDQTGRDAIAIRVWKPGGLQLEWSQPWTIALFQDANNKSKTYLQQLTENFILNNEKDDQFSSKFLYKIRERFDLLNPEDTEDVFDEETATSLMAMEYIQSGKTSISKIKNANEPMNKAKDAVRPLIKQCRPVIRDIEKAQDDWQRKPLTADAALLVRFLAQKGVE